MEQKRLINFGIVGIVAILVLFIIFGTIYTIPAGYRGVVLTFGKPSMDAKGEGLGFKIPLMQKIVKMDVKTQKYESDASAASRDLQVVTAVIAVNYHIVPEMTPDIYKNIGLAYNERITQPTVQEVVKASTAQFTAEELITRRPEVKQMIKDLLVERLQTRGIVVEDINIVNFDFSKSFNDAIEAKVTAEQNALQAKNKLEQIKYEAEQTVAKAQAEAEALRLKKQSITPELVQLSQIEVQSKALDVQREAITKWNGMLPQVTGNNIPFIGIDLTPEIQ